MNKVKIKAGDIIELLSGLKGEVTIINKNSITILNKNTYSQVVKINEIKCINGASINRDEDFSELL